MTVNMGKHSFSRVTPPQIPRSMFERPNTHSTTLNAGYLVPVFIDEVLPGDTIEMEAVYLARLLSLATPAMAGMYLDVHTFFVPNRILWENWEKLNGASDEAGAQETDYLVPQILNDGSSYQPNTRTIWDYFGIPVGVSLPQADMPISLPLRAYNLIWNEWYRDQNFQNKVNVPLDDGPDNPGNYTLLKRNKRKDYFTSALPWPQKGDSVSIALMTDTSVDVFGDGQALGLWDGGSNSSDRYGLYAWSSQTTPQFSTGGYGQNLPGTAGAGSAKSGDSLLGVTSDPTKSGLTGTVNAIDSITINELRQAIAMQQMLERDARGGTRYTEILKAHFGVDVPDYRLQRPEYIGGLSQRIDIRPVTQTSESNTTPQGNQAAFSSTVGKNRIQKSFVEHGFVISLASIRHDIQYQQGMRRMWSRRTREDFYDPIFAHLAEQAVLVKEIFATDNNATNNEVWGYQERSSEYRYFPSMITGLLRTNVTAGNTSLDKWHLADHYTAKPVLNGGFLAEDPDIARIVAVTDEDHFLLDCYFNLKHYRPIPIFSQPGLERL